MNDERVYIGVNISQDILDMVAYPTRANLAIQKQ
jgi:hypothetical protein